MSVKVAINGFGRIGRLAFRQMFGADGYEIVAINDLTTPKMLAHLLKYDSTQGNYVAQGHSVDWGDGSITVDGKEIPIYAKANAAELPWGELEIDVVLECTGFYSTKAKAQAHIDAGAKKVVISSPAGNDLPTIVYNVNHETLEADDNIISAASCTTNCLAPMAKALNDLAPIESGIMCTIHAYTGDQMILDGPQRKGNLRRSRAAAVNIVPNSTGAAKAIGLVIPELNGKLIGSAQRVPTPTGSTTLLVAVVKGAVTADDINAAMKNGKTLSETVSITVEQDYTVYLSIDLLTLNSNSWAKIREISDAGTGKNYWSAGDCKAVPLSGTMGTLALDTTLWVYILGFDHNKDVEGSGIQFGGFKTDSGSSGINVCLIDANYNSYKTDGTITFNMNHWGNYNYGGWAGSDMRYDILGSTDVAPSGYGAKKTTSVVGYDATTSCPTSPVANTLMSCLPAELRAVMKPITKWTNNVGNSGDTEEKVTAMVDYLPLLAEFEIFGTRSYANSYEQNHQAQYEYFSAGNSKVKYRHSATGSTAIWWERSPRYGNTNSFCFVSTSGTAGSNYAYYSYGVAPAFMV